MQNSYGEPLCDVNGKVVQAPYWLTDGDAIVWSSLIPCTTNWRTNQASITLSTEFKDTYFHIILQCDGQITLSRWWFYQSTAIQFVAGHRYCLFASNATNNVTYQATSNKWSVFSNNSEISSGDASVFDSIDKILTAKTDGNSRLHYASSTNTYYEISNDSSFDIYTNLFDLTTMGVPEDVTTADQFAQALGYDGISSMPYFPPSYNGTYIAHNGKLYKQEE